MLEKFITEHITPEFKENLKAETLKEATLVADSLFDEKIQEVLENCSSKTKTIVKEALVKYDKQLKESQGSGAPAKIIHEINIGDVKTSITGIMHDQFDTILTIVADDIPVFLTGPAGGGKNFICKQIAEALKLPFYFTNAVTQEYRLTGFIDANGKYHETQFYKAFKYGGLFMLDELDASIPETLVVLNAAIANRYFDFPNEHVEAHKDFRIIAAGNTFGTGANEVYVGRYQLDAASLDRFVTVPMNYSSNIEKAITNNNTALISFCHSFRKAALQSDIHCIFSYRALTAISKLESSDLGLAKILKIALVKSLSKDDLRTICNVMDMKDNKYYRALVSLVS